MTKVQTSWDRLPAGQIGTKKGHDNWEWRDVDWQSRGRRQYPWTDTRMQAGARARAQLTPEGRAAAEALCTQVCASYAHRMDLTAAAKVPGLLGRARPLLQEEACAQARAPSPGDCTARRAVTAEHTRRAAQMRVLCAALEIHSCPDNRRLQILILLHMCAESQCVSGRGGRGGIEPASHAAGHRLGLRAQSHDGTGDDRGPQPAGQPRRCRRRAQRQGAQPAWLWPSAESGFRWAPFTRESICLCECIARQQLHLASSTGIPALCCCTWQQAAPAAKLCAL